MSTVVSEFIRVGKNIVPKPLGTDYDLKEGQVYDLNWDRYSEQYIFTENGELNLPKKVYELRKDTIFKKRVLSYFENASMQTTGVMLAGTKGTGKTVLAKVLAKESNLPIIVVNGEYPAHKLNKFFKEFKTPVCVIFDEVEKNWRTEHMLEFLDGVQATAKKLVIMTCNDLDRVSEYMQDRCSRIRYMRKYNADENVELIEQLVIDFEVKNPKEVAEFIKNKFKLMSMDNLCAFINEVKIFEDDDLTLDELLSIMNISYKDIDIESISKSNKDENINDLKESVLQTLRATAPAFGCGVYGAGGC